MARDELASFVRTRRQRLRPSDLGLPHGSRRRTPGLRREEVAQLAHMSVEYYARIEQARGPQPSRRILQSLSEALRLDDAERLQLFRLAQTVPEPMAGPIRVVRPHVAKLLDRLPGTAAIVTDARYDVIACNPLARLLMSDLDDERNLARRRFVHGSRWSSASDEFAEIAVARLRNSAARYPGDPRLTALLAELRTHDEFTAIWASAPVRTPGHRSKTLQHRTLGPLRVNCNVLTVPDDDQQVVFMTADAGSSTERAFRELQRAV